MMYVPSINTETIQKYHTINKKNGIIHLNTQKNVVIPLPVFKMAFWIFYIFICLYYRNDQNIHFLFLYYLSNVQNNV